MKAIRVRQFGDPDVLRLHEMPCPIPGSGQVVVRNRAIGINPVETYIRAGKYSILPELPYTPGSDSAGDIVAVGGDVTDVKVGDRVYAYGSLTGAYAELSLRESWQVHPLPEHVTYQQGAAVGTPVGAAWRALFIRGNAQAGETVLIHGATGTAGISAVQFARAAGLTVIGTAGDDIGRRQALENGAHFVMAHGAVDEIKSHTTDSAGPNLILEMLADKNLAADLKLLAPRGRVVVIGCRGMVEIDPRMTMSTELDIRGMSLNNMTREENIAMHKALMAALEARILRPIVGEEVPLAEAARAHELVSSGKAEGKVVLKT